MWFSQRKKLAPVRVEVQRDDIDPPLRNKLWSAYYLISHDLRWLDHEERRHRVQLWLHFFEEPSDTIPYDFQSWVRGWFFRAKWHEVYSFLEAAFSTTPERHQETFRTLMNDFLEQEVAAYRLVNGYLTDIVSAEEIESIETAARDTEPFAPVRTHLVDALAKLTDRNNPDYRNSIKESISAVEAICQIITGDRAATLGVALKRLGDNGVQLHPALLKVWSILYGYTSDAAGIRHALTDEPNVSYSEAKYMLVSCSAFVTHLIDLSRQAGLKLERTS